jgi:hypothetical protein
MAFKPGEKRPLNSGRKRGRRVMDDETVPMQFWIEVSKCIADRALGKPPQTADTDNGAAPAPGNRLPHLHRPDRTYCR